MESETTHSWFVERTGWDVSGMHLGVVVILHLIPMCRGFLPTAQSNFLSDTSWVFTPPPQGAPWETQDEKAQDTGWGAYQRNDFNEPWLLQIPIPRRGLNSFKLRYLVFNGDLLMFQLPDLCSKLLYALTLPDLLGAVSRNYLRCLIPGLSPQFCPPHKT